MPFEIESGLTVPPRKSGGRGRGEEKYPLSKMKPGDSFLVKIDLPKALKGEEREATFKTEAKKFQARLSGAVNQYRKRNPDTKFTIRSVDDETYGHGIRVWRTE